MGNISYLRKIYPLTHTTITIAVIDSPFLCLLRAYSFKETKKREKSSLFKVSRNKISDKAFVDGT